MPRTPISDVLQLSVRLPPQVVFWLRDLAKEMGQGDMATIHRRIVEDAWNWFGLPAPMVDSLKRDCEAQGMNPSTPREYVMNLLALRFAELRSQESKKK